ncbi:hypothetical protein Q7362_08410, partial [Glaesserella parasuis]|nr:hypothetical protein [Glaesserella parasuis]
FVHNKIPVSECIISETGIYTNCGRGSITAMPFYLQMPFTLLPCSLSLRSYTNFVPALKPFLRYNNAIQQNDF